jgi:hypothetical protein
MPAMAGASPEDTAAVEFFPAGTGEAKAGQALTGGPSGGRCALVLSVLAICAVATVGFGVYPDPLLDFASHAGEAIAEIVRP